MNVLNKGLNQLGFASVTTANHTDYTSITGYVCCGWMEIHEDSRCLGEEQNKIFVVNPIFWDDDAVFIVKPRTKWQFLSKNDFINRRAIAGIKYTASGFSFNATRLHGLVPTKISVKLKDPDFVNAVEYKSFEIYCRQRVSPKLIWTWGKQDES